MIQPELLPLLALPSRFTGRPTRRIALCSLALALGCAGCGGAAMPHGSPAADPSGEELFRMAERGEQAGDSVRAEQYAVAASRKGIGEERTTPLLVRVCLAADRPRSALRYAEAYLERHPLDAGLRYVVAATHQALGDTDASLAALGELVRQHPRFAPGHYLLGVVLRDTGELEAARGAFTVHLRLAPQSPHAEEIRVFLDSHATRPCAVPKGRAGGKHDPRSRSPADSLCSSRAAQTASRGPDGQRDPRQRSL